MTPKSGYVTPTNNLQTMENHSQAVAYIFSGKGKYSVDMTMNIHVSTLPPITLTPQLCCVTPAVNLQTIENPTQAMAHIFSGKGECGVNMT